MKLSNSQLVLIVERLVVHVASLMIESLRDLGLIALAIRFEELREDILIELINHFDEDGNYTGGENEQAVDEVST